MERLPGRHRFLLVNGACCLASTHGSAPFALGNGAFIANGADAIEGFLDIGAGLTVIVEDALDDAGCCCWMEGAAMEGCGTGGGAACCICWIHAGWTRRNLMSSSVTPAIHDWTLSCSCMIWSNIPLAHRRQHVASN